MPKLREIALVWRTLSSLLPVEAVEHGWRESQKGVINYRVAATTNGRRWSVDTYHGEYYVVTVSDRFPEPCKSLPSMAWYLCRMLGVNLRGPK